MSKVGRPLCERIRLTDHENPTGYSQALADVTADGAAKTNYYYADGFGPIAQAHNPGSAGFNPQYLLGDHLSTTRGLTDSAGAFQSYAYSPFGSITSGDSSLTNYYFTGQWREERTGLQHHRARWLDADKGRWESVDPLFDWPENYGNVFLYAD